MTQPSRRKGGLGRGLASLIPTGPADADSGPATLGPRMGSAAADVLIGGGTAAGPDAAAVGSMGAVYREIAPADIERNPRQPRQVFDEEALSELVHSIREFGLLQPIVVRAVSESQSGARYQIVMGERRWRAAQEAGLATIPAIVRETGDDNLLRDALLENIHRVQLNPLEEAAAYQQLLDEFDVTHDELAARIGRSRPLITNMIRLLKLPIPVQRRVAAGVLSAGHARALLSLEAGPEAQEELASTDRRGGPVGAGHRGGGHSGQSRRHDHSGAPAPQADSDAWPPRRCRPPVERFRHPGDGQPRQTQGQDRGRVRLGGGSAANYRHDDPVRRLTSHFA